MPPAYRGVWFFNDWLRKTTFVYRPRWDGALIQPEGGRWQPFASGGGSGRAVANYGGGRESGVPALPARCSSRSTLSPVLTERSIISGWGEEYGVVWKDGQQANEGRIFRISWPGAPATRLGRRRSAARPVAQWTFEELVEDLGSLLPVWSVDAQDELVRRGAAVKERAHRGCSAVADCRRRRKPGPSGRWAGSRRPTAASTRGLPKPAGRFRPTPASRRSGSRLTGFASTGRPTGSRRTSWRRYGTLSRACALRPSRPSRQARQRQLVPQVADLAASESDRVTLYAAWQALRDIAAPDVLRALLKDKRGAVRRAALLALLESRALEPARGEAAGRGPRCGHVGDCRQLARQVRRQSAHRHLAPTR